DGIRDFHVTGVQTCALPISLAERKRSGKSPLPNLFVAMLSEPVARHKAAAAAADACRVGAVPDRRARNAPRNKGSRGSPSRRRRSEERRVGKGCWTRCSREV